jgi:GNAT superfamily N-acetyltransferase
MTRTDVDRVGEVLYEAFKAGALKHGYAPRMQSAQEGKAWAWAMLHHGPNELLVAEVENRVVGLMCLNPRGNHGGIGPLAIDPHFEGKGLARELMQAIIKKAERLQSIRGLQEAFNPASFALLTALDFVAGAIVVDLFRDARIAEELDLCSSVTESMPGDLDAIHAYDTPRSKFDRQTDLAYYAKRGKTLVYREQSEIRGYLACLPGPESVQLGPLVAEGDDEAKSLFRYALTVYKERSFRTCVLARDGVLVKALMSLGFKVYCLDVMVVRGSWRPGEYVEAFGRFPEGT